MRKVILAVLVFTGISAQAQKFGQKLSGGFDVTVGIPSGEFADANNNVAFGLRGHLMYNPARQAPIYIGLEMGLASMAPALNTSTIPGMTATR